MDYQDFVNSPQTTIMPLMLMAIFLGFLLAKMFKNRPAVALVVSFLALMAAFAALLVFNPEIKQALIDQAGIAAETVQMEYYKMAAITAAGFAVFTWLMTFAIRRGDRVRAEKAERKAAKKAAKKLNT